MAHKLPPLRFGYDKHHKAYVDNLNKALEPYPHLAELAVEDLHRLDQVPEKVRTAVGNNGGGHVNHQFFWDILGPRADGAPKGAIADAIKRDFGSFEQFQSPLYRRGYKTLRLGVGVPRREPLAEPPRDRAAAQPGQRAGARDTGAPLLRSGSTPTI